MATKGPRIPEALQQVFLASNRGKEVHKPPPGNVAVRVFKRTWFWQKKSSSITPRLESAPEPTEKVDLGTPRKSKRGDKVNSLISMKKKKTSGKKSKKSGSSSADESPQVYLWAILESRGYSLEEYPALDSAYHNSPTPLQEASYGSHILDVVRRGEVDELRQLLATGLSPNACNHQSESLVHMACRRGDVGCLNLLIEHGASVQIADDYGRTPLHDVCWSSEPNFELVEIIMQKDIRLFNIVDGRKQSPLSYVRTEAWKPWKKFLLRVCDVYWPPRDIRMLGPQGPPPLTLERPNSRSLSTPKAALPLELASMVAQGKMDPAEAMFLKHEAEDDGSVGGTSSSYSQSEGDDDVDDASSSSGGSDSDFSFDEDEMAMILQSVGGSVPFDWKN